MVNSNCICYNLNSQKLPRYKRPQKPHISGVFHYYMLNRYGGLDGVTITYKKEKTLMQNLSLFLVTTTYYYLLKLTIAIINPKIPIMTVKIFILFGVILFK